MPNKQSAASVFELRVVHFPDAAGPLGRRHGDTLLYKDVGLWSSEARALAGFAQYGASYDEDDIFYLVIHELRIDPPQDRRPDSVLSSAWFYPDGTLRGRYQGPHDAPFAGRLPKHCRFGPGDVVAYGERTYNLAVVVARPPPPKEARRMQLEAHEDVYLVYPFTEGDLHDHEHPDEASLFPPVAPVDPALRAALAARYEQVRQDRGG